MVILVSRGEKMVKIIKILFKNIHTICLFLAASSFVYGAFLLDPIIGWMILGSVFLATGIAINKELG
ncbi:hypothetical protein D922_01523 [Enterococcus faecalis 06-MB-DW-09]|nr:hypothetical protein D922_01523 [Enterococcus faecalis 06-MB-DW-09]